MLRIEHYEYSSYKDSIKQIYINSFPLEERFSFSILKKCNKELNVHLSCIVSDDIPVGMQFTVELPNNIIYLMYFAIDEMHRNKGLGSKALRNLVVVNENVLLCIERPCDKVTNARKEFYLRNGFYETNIFIEDADIQYEFLTSVKGYKPTTKDLLYRYKFMTSKKYVWNRIRKYFNTDFIKFID